MLLVQVTCSVGGTCAIVTMSASSSTKTASPAAVTDVPAANQAPTITLVTTTSFSNIIHVRRGGIYGVCKQGVLPTVAAPCEPGATAVDPDGLVTDGSLHAKPLDKTAEIVVCPPDSCLTRGCSPAELRRHYFNYKGLNGCGIDTDATEGTQYQVCCCTRQASQQLGITACQGHWFPQYKSYSWLPEGLCNLAGPDNTSRCPSILTERSS